MVRSASVVCLFNPWPAVDVAVIAPLPKEWHAVKAHLEDVEEPLSTFPTAVGSIRPYRVVIRTAPETGEGTTADIALNVVTEWNPNWLARVGVAGESPKKGVGLGNVAVALKIYADDFRKILTASGEQPSFVERRDGLDVDVLSDVDVSIGQRRLR